MSPGLHQGSIPHTLLRLRKRDNDLHHFSKAYKFKESFN
jgi:hypothetical protein